METVFYMSAEGQHSIKGMGYKMASLFSIGRERAEERIQGNF